MVIFRTLRIWVCGVCRAQNSDNNERCRNGCGAGNVVSRHDSAPPLIRCGGALSCSQAVPYSMAAAPSDAAAAAMQSRRGSEERRDDQAAVRRLRAGCPP